MEIRSHVSFFVVHMALNGDVTVTDSLLYFTALLHLINPRIGEVRDLWGAPPHP